MRQISKYLLSIELGASEDLCLCAMREKPRQYTGGANFEAAVSTREGAGVGRPEKVKKRSGERKEVQLVLPGRFPMGEVGNSYSIFRRAGET